MLRRHYALLLLTVLLGANSCQADGPARGPLRVCPENPRYFTDGQRSAIFLTGAHTWTNLQDETLPNSALFDFEEHLKFLDRHRHNFIRLWRWELLNWDNATMSAWSDNRNVYATAPHPWKRTGPGLARDGKPKFDLEQFDLEYFDRLRQRVQAAGEHGIYVSIMLFEGWGTWGIDGVWKGHPFSLANNINGIEADTNGDGICIEYNSAPPTSPGVAQLQEAYVRKVIETVNDLDNVLYEIENEAGTYSTEWQYAMIRLVKQIESAMPQQHPVGMTFQYAPNRQYYGSNAALFASPADWISIGPKADGDYGYQTSPPVADGSKVLLTDSDHLWGIGGNVDWAWKSFIRGHQPLFMDPYDNSLLGKTPPESWEPLRKSLGQVRQLADRVELASMVPHDELASTSYCLANPGREYVAFLPKGGHVDVDLSASAGMMDVEWIPPVDGGSQQGEQVSGGDMATLAPPFNGAAVLYLKKR